MKYRSIYKRLFANKKKPIVNKQWGDEAPKDIVDHFAESSELSTVWMVTFADLLSLILTFFILLYAVQNQDRAKFEDLGRSLVARFSANSNDYVDDYIAESVLQAVVAREAIDINYLELLLKNQLGRIEGFSVEWINNVSGTLEIKLNNKEIFVDDKISVFGELVIDQLVDIVKDVGNNIVLEIPRFYNSKESRMNYLKKAILIAVSMKNRGYIYDLDIVKLDNKEYADDAIYINIQEKSEGV